MLCSVVLLAASFDKLAGTTSSSKPGSSPPIVRMTGMIEDGDAARLRSLLSEIQNTSSRLPGAPLATIEMSSLGGDLIEGMKLGYLFREFDVATVVRTGDLCLSSCALAFLGGTARHRGTDFAVSRTVEVGATLGFHNFWLNPNHERARDAASPREGIAKGFNEAKGAAARLVHYATFLGVDAGFIARMLGRPPEVWDYADTVGKFIDLRICPSGLRHSLPQYEQRVLNMCSNILGDTVLPATSVGQPQIREMMHTEAKRHLLAHVQQNIATFNVRGPLAKQLAGVVSSRDDKLVDSTYADLRAAGLVLPELVGPTFEVRGLTAAEFDLECIVSLSSDDPDRFDIVLTGSAGFIRPTRPGPPSCGRILGFDRDDVINPSKR